MDFEKNLTRLSEIVQKLEVGNMNLTESIELYKEGIKLHKQCTDFLEKAELTIKEITEE